MKTETFALKLVQDGLVKGIVWQEETLQPKAVVLIIHGMAEHIKRYDAFARFLASHAFIVYGYDQRGHGESVDSLDDLGYMSDIDNLQVMVSDVSAVVALIKSKHLDLPVYLLGHSMGSFISQRYMELYGSSVQGVILSGSGYNKSLMIRIGYIIAKLITRFKGRKHRSLFMDKLTLGAYNKTFEKRTAVDWLSRDEKIVDAYVADPYCGTLFSISYFKDLLKCFKTIWRNFEIIPNELPVYIFSGENDPVGNFGKSVRRLKAEFIKTGVTNVEMKLYPGGRHEMLNEINREEVFQDVLAWLNKQCC